MPIVLARHTRTYGRKDVSTPKLTGRPKIEENSNSGREMRFQNGLEQRLSRLELQG